MTAQVLIAGRWRDADAVGTFQATNPATNETLPAEFPVSSWKDCDAALDAAVEAAREMRRLQSGVIANFLECYADKIEGAKVSTVKVNNSFSVGVTPDGESIWSGSKPAGSPVA